MTADSFNSCTADLTGLSVPCCTLRPFSGGARGPAAALAQGGAPPEHARVCCWATAAGRLLRLLADAAVCCWHQCRGAAGCTGGSGAAAVSNKLRIIGLRCASQRVAHRRWGVGEVLQVSFGRPVASSWPGVVWLYIGGDLVMVWQCAAGMCWACGHAGLCCVWKDVAQMTHHAQ